MAEQTLSTPEDRAVAAVRGRNPEHTNFVVLSTVPNFQGGTLYIVTFKDATSQGFENYAHVPADGGHVEVYRNTVQLAQSVSANPHPQNFLGLAMRVIDRLVGLGGMAGLIGLGITATICYLTVSAHGETKIPDVLSNALTMVLGFYFGAKAGASRNE